MDRERLGELLHSHRGVAATRITSLGQTWRCGSG